MKLEAVVLPVADVDRAKAFYQALGWRLDADFPIAPDSRVVHHGLGHGRGRAAAGGP
jgi:catechol 2,3-dioxygenase-like lactoylglutathione lyase family enzyme